MDSGLGTIALAVLPIFGIIVLGVLLRRGRVLTRSADESVLSLTINVLIPCLVWDSIIGNPALDNPANAWIPPLIGFGGVVIGLFVARRVAPWAGLRSAPQAGTFALATGLYNWAYLSLPICALLFGRETVGVLFVHNLGVEIAMWSAGLMLLTGRSSPDAWKRLVNGPVIAIVSALVLNALDAALWLPGFLTRGVAMLGASAIPIGLLLVGATFWDHLGEADIFRHVRVGAVACLLRLAFLPTVFLLAIWALPLSAELQQVLMVQAAMPSAVFPVIMAKRYGGDVPTALRVVLWTSLVGVITLPLWIHFGLLWLGGR